MFDLIKIFLGMPTCRGCRYRRFWGLYCGCKEKGVFPHKAWDSNANWCWHYADKEKVEKWK